HARPLPDDLTCRQTVALQLELLGHDPREAGRAADNLLERVGLADRAGDRPGSLSGGEQQRVAVCAAVAHRPGLLLADEPAGELDAENGALVYRLLGELVREARGSALIVSHDAAAASIADRLVHVRDGRVVEEARPARRSQAAAPQRAPSPRWSAPPAREGGGGCPSRGPSAAGRGRPPGRGGRGSRFGALAARRAAPPPRGARHPGARPGAVPQ